MCANADNNDNKIRTHHPFHRRTCCQVAAFIHAAADEVINHALDYVLSKDRDFQAYNFAPRMGAAWQVTPKTVVRGGFGLFYDLGDGNVGDASSSCR